MTTTVAAGAGAEALAEAIRERFASHIREKIRISPQHSNRASSLGHPCEMRSYLDRAKWDKVAPVDEGLQRIFERGNEMEPVVRRLLEDLGIRVTGEQMAVKWDAFQITGHNDFRIADTDKWGRIVVEIKSTGNPKFAKARTAEDLRGSELGEKWYAQVQLYMLLGNYDQAIMVIIDVLSWQLVVIPVALDYEYAETLLKRAERINAAITSKRDGEGLALINNPKICRRCPHYGVSCTPSVNFGDGVTVLADDGLTAMLDRRGELEPAAKEFAALDTEVKDAVKTKGEMVIAGDWMIENTEVTQKRSKVPPEIAAQYQTTSSYVKSHITRLESPKP